MALIAGPTASGKSALAVRLGQTMPSVVINADSMQVYADLHILSARPGKAEMGGVPHALFGHIDGADACSAARWAAEARNEIAKAHAAGLLPILCGGTGLYLRTLLDGIAPVPDIDPVIRAAARALPVLEAHQALTREDPAAAEKLSPNDTTRVARALETIRSTGKPLATWQADRIGGIADAIDLVPLILLPPRDWLFERIERRFAQMVDQGAENEVRTLLARHLDPALPAMRAIGVPEIAAFLKGDLSRAAMIERGMIATRQYGKRQYTWFSRQTPSDWNCRKTQLSDSNLDELAIILRDTVLTG
ncbi:tRNA dimethylallyltransferase [Sphingobium boeckii]|uniref:tRNA dimethylallyltransferase n=1 Tax=Sphingobium boeckii TaxID=1082345 RepID=A0A7W9EGU6_9SPHN|nr:tRNA dimethylallyltransferase [Sphingobium boeckii]